jgi:hypothetical protein
MLNILRKEMKLSASRLSYLFMLFGLMFLIPGYPILCGAFFVALGIFQSYQNARETNDLVFSALLPIARRDVVKGKYLFTAMIELGSLLLMAICTALRMTIFSQTIGYRENALMNANLFALGTAFVLFGLFNLIFVGGFFETGYKLGQPFLLHILVSFLLIGAAEAAHHFPGGEWLNAFGFESMGRQMALLGSGAVTYIFLTAASCRSACRKFEKIDL